MARAHHHLTSVVPSGPRWPEGREEAGNPQEEQQTSGYKDNPERGLSFGSVAEDYDRYRPWPPRAAMEWILPHRVAVALDLGAGTGALSRRLLARADEVVAVEPDERMRAVLARSLPRVHVQAGRAESLPLPDASVDAVLVSSAWHWLDPASAVPEIARVLRRGGIFGILWTGLDWQAAFGSVVGQALRDTDAGAAADRRSHEPEDVRLPPGAPFGRPETIRLPFHWQVSPERLIGLLGPYSSIFTLPQRQRTRVLDQARAFLSTDPRFAGQRRLDVAMSCRCWKAVRL